MEATTAAPTQAAPPPRLRERYREEILPELIGKFGYSSPLAAPRLEKITLNMGVGDAKQDSNLLDAATEQLATIAGQQPNVRRARKSIASFKVREGMPVGVSVTLRRARMWEFLDRLCSVAVPRIRDFRGLNPRSFDGRGNYSMGIREQLIFPEIDYDSIDQVRGLDITITTSAAVPTRRPSSCCWHWGCRSPRRDGPAAVEDEEASRRGGAPQGRGAAAGRGRAGGAGAAQGREPGGLRQAREARGGRGRRGRRRGRGRRRDPARGGRGSKRERSKADGEDFAESQTEAQAQVQVPGLSPLPTLRSPAGLLPQVRPLPDLPARGGASGLHPGHDQVKLVTSRC